MTQYWEADLFAYILILLIVIGLCSVWLEWWRRRKVWRSVPKHMGSTYDASVDAKIRPNVRRA